MSIQWFPGHMHRARLALKKLLPDIDIVIELLDARAPFSSLNPLIQNLIKHKRKIRILNKSDLADPDITGEWLEYFRNQSNTTAIPGFMQDKKQRQQIISLCRKMVPERNSFEKPLRVMITGIPNVGKSTLINQLLNKKSAKTGDIPAVTKANQCLTLASDFLLYDTPGIMWEKIEKPHIGCNLGLCNSIGRNALDTELLANYLVSYTKTHYPKILQERYKITASDLNGSSDSVISLIGTKRGAIEKGGIVNLEKAYMLLIQDFREGKLGKISLERSPLLAGITASPQI